MAGSATASHNPTSPRVGSRRIRIGVMVNNVGGYSRGVLRGVASYAFARAWECQVQGVNGTSRTVASAELDGLIVQARSLQSVERLLASGLAIVNVSSSLGSNALPTVVSDDAAVGRAGADHFLRRGFRHFAYFAPRHDGFAKLRHDGFLVRLREAGHQATRIEGTNRLSRVLADLPRPLAVMGCNDAAALVVLDQCRALGLKVPNEVAVLGVDNDDLIQSLAFPPLSSINMATERIGFEAAALLERLMLNEEPTVRHVMIPPTGVVTRQSTDGLAIDDGDVAEALRFIRDHAGSPIGVDDVRRCVNLSRRQLERRFRAALGRSVLDEVRRYRIERARQLLSDTELTIPQVASACGFTTASYFSVSFKEATGASPGAYRAQYRIGRE